MANKLINEQSPYLLQHAHNPVDWHPWGEEAFQEAKTQNKPVIVSIGYSSCHWCHVMERESFEDPVVATYMNKHFINIKVDREEYPDVDDFYMTAIQALSGTGGWPLNAFVTPDKVPFYGGTYYPPRPIYNRPSWMQLMERIVEIWETTPNEVKQQADQMLTYLGNAARPSTKQTTGEWTFEIAEKAATQMLQHADKKNGGFGRAPKFPSVIAIAFLLEHYHFSGNKEALHHALLSLDSMIGGGIYDQLGGGFARYATDNSWLVPHFEKMLYDNAQLVSVLSDAYIITRKSLYRETIVQTIDFLFREMKAGNGGFYCALDADTEGVEGKFYTWEATELNTLLANFPEYIKTYFGITEEGNWEGVNILHRASSAEAIATAAGLDADVVVKKIGEAAQFLFKERKKRVRPGTDDKCLLSWNALANIALTKASIALDNQRYLEEAGKHLEWMYEAYDCRSTLKHTWKNGIAKIEANLDDYAYLIQAMLTYDSASGDAKWKDQAIALTGKVIRLFGDETNPLFYFTSMDQKNIPVRKQDTYDGVTPSGNAIMADNLALLSLIHERSDWLERAQLMLLQMKEPATRYSTSFAFWNLTMQRFVKGYKTVKVVGPEAKAFQALLQKHLSPGCHITTEHSENLPDSPASNEAGKQTLIYVCNKNQCFAPVDNVAQAIDSITL